jgi:hypothetical protein
MLATTKFTRFFLYGLLCLMFGLVPSAYGTTTYSSNFPLTENSISENGKWINGKTMGLDWANVRTSPGLAFGAQTDTAQYDDSTAILMGTWGADQSAWATVHTVNQSSSLFEEVEIRLRTSISTNRITGYEVSFRCTADGSQYVQIVRWNGPLGDLTYVSATTGPGIHDGDVVKATIAGNTITAYINGVQVVQGTDSTYTSGSPGMGFNIQGGSASQEADYGFNGFAATDGGSTARANLALASSSPGTYTTNFPLTENPISEGGIWTNGAAVGLDWSNVQTTGGVKAWGTQVPSGAGFNDSIAVLKGTWGGNQTATGVSAIQPSATNEIEVLLHGTITAHSAQLYELNCSLGYQEIVKWLGPLGSFSVLAHNGSVSCPSGTTFKGTAVTNANGSVTVTAFINNVQVNQITDSSSPYTGGAPGIGFWIGGGANNNNAGISSYTASGLLTSPNPPTGLTAAVN